MTIIDSPPTVVETWRTIRTVARRECVEHVRTPGVWILIGLSCALAYLSTQANSRRFTAASHIYAELLAQRDRDATRAAGQLTGWQIEPSLRVLRRPEPLSSLTLGNDYTLPQYWDFGPAGTRFGWFPSQIHTYPRIVDLELVLRVILGVLAISLAIETVAGERASGALLALLGQPIRPHLIAAGKLLGALTILSLASLLVVCIPAAELAVTLHLRAIAIWPSVAGAVLATVLYLFTCLSVSVTLAALFRTYRRATTAIIVVWAVWAVPGPAWVALAAQSLKPVEPHAIIEMSSETLSQKVTEDVQRTMGEAFAGALGGPVDWARNQSDAPVRQRAERIAELIWDARKASLESALLPMAEQWMDQTRRHFQLERIVAVLSPSAELADCLTNLFGTGDRNAERWLDGTLQRQRQLDDLLFLDRPRIVMLVPTDLRGQADTVIHRTVVAFNRRPLPTVSSVPSNTEQLLPMGRRYLDAAPQLSILALYSVASALLAIAVFTRMRV